MKLRSWTFNFGPRPSFWSVICGSCFARKREVPGWMDSLLFGCLSTTPPFCVGLCVWKRSSHAWCFAFLVDCFTGFASQKCFIMYSILLVSRWRNARFTLSLVVDVGVVCGGVRPAAVQPKTFFEVLRNYQGVCVCLVDTSRRRGLLLLAVHCSLVDESAICQLYIRRDFPISCI